jgi:hypothetical protein
MTTIGESAPAAAGDPARQGDRTGGSVNSAPVIVLTYGYAGARQLQRLLTDQPELATTFGTGLLAACDQAASAWRQVERRPEGKLSPLARTSIRAMASGMIATITARAGRPRWCETAAAERSAAEVFLDLFPGTRFVCLHRACQDVIYATLQASPWGLTGQAYVAYTASYPANTTAALAAWWVSHAAPVLAFEQDHPQACLRVRYEDLAAGPGQAENSIRDFLGLRSPSIALPELPGDPVMAMTGADRPGCGAELPASQLPPLLLAQVNELHTRLGYPTLGAEPAE